MFLSSQAVDAGEFTVTFELTGFLALKASGIPVLVAQTTRVDGELQVGSLYRAACHAVSAGVCFSFIAMQLLIRSSV